MKKAKSTLPVYRVEFYKAKDGERWRVLARNNKIICESGEAFSSFRASERSFDNVAEAFKSGIHKTWLVRPRKQKR